ncbi:MAG: malto-oligosyltrehalose synthase [Bacteroidota bacterium]
MNPYNPVSTYRIQFYKDFTFRDAEEVTDYLHSLGIKTIYASPIFQAVKGSVHGYDVTDPLQLNEEIGNKEDFDSLIQKIHEKGMGWIQDFVPNHMAFSSENPWIFDLLLKGNKSRFYSFFDLFADHPDKDLQEKIMLPFFGKEIDEVVNEKELKIEFNEKGFTFRYYENSYPVSIGAYQTLFKFSSFKKIPDSILKFQNSLSSSAFMEEVGKLYHAYTRKDTLYKFINNCLEEVNSDPSLIKKLLKELSFIPVYWKETEKRINYRRFFTINSLICLNIHKKEVFRIYHSFLKILLEQKYLDGLRVDHVDGLADPNKYLDDLRALSGPDSYIIVEKILEENEKLPETWPVQGSTGYDFLSMVNNLLANRKSEKDFLSFYKNWNEDPADSQELILDKKRFILHNRLKGELDILAYQCQKIPAFAMDTFDQKQIREAIAEFLVHFPVYKIYKVPSQFEAKEKAFIKDIFKRAIRNNKHTKATLYFLRSMFLLAECNDLKVQSEIDAFFRRCMQFTGPLMAKGIEDTAFYSYHPLLAFNEVGDSPEYFGISVKKFHRLMKERQETIPLSMNTLATHDTKRGDDARARILVLGDIPKEWRKITRHWQEINHKSKSVVNGRPVPTSNDEYFIYQTLCGHLPMDGKVTEDFIARLKKYLIKAFRESKVNSSWSEPDTAYENKTLEFIEAILSPQHAFHQSFTAFVNGIIPHGIINSITQTILKNTLPGVPDTYQGSEIWNLSFVDPDNRAPVDYKNLASSLEMLIRDYLTDPVSMTQRLWQNTTNGFIKHWISYLTLQERTKDPDLFIRGSYIPLKIKGKYKKHIMAFLRRHRDSYLLVVLP